jgi:glycosyltransferase involved in cell wall biosynthesis
VTSVREVWGVVVNEGLAHDLYVIASNEVEAARSLVEENTGRIVPADDVDAIVAALREFAAMRHSRPSGASSGGRIRECTAGAFADKYLEAVNLAVSRRGASDLVTNE